jgi:four helix bundle protein
MFRFEKLDVWQRAISFATGIYRDTARFPADERFGLTTQMRRAAVSISSNIAEGSSRSSDSDFARYLEIAFGSLMEIVSQAVIAKNEGFLPEDRCRELYQNAEDLSRMLSGLNAHLLKGKTEGQGATPNKGV